MTRNTSRNDDATHKPSSHRKSPPRNAALKFTPEVWSPDEVIEAGREAAEALESPVFNLACCSLIDDLKQEWTHTQPHEKERREWLYNQTQALGAVMHSLLALFRQAQELEAGVIAAERERQRRANEARGGIGSALDS